MSYFEKEWLSDKTGWYEGFEPYQCPSTNNALERLI
jgi:hypothetical protein